MSISEGKIFCVGLSKTGTTSLARALEILGYRTKDYLGVENYIPGDLSSVNIEEINANDAFTDTPIPSFYRELDAAYPESKFILTVRDMDGWLHSCKKQFTQKQSEQQSDAQQKLFTDLYDCCVFDEHKFRSGYQRFVNGVFSHFEDRPEDLLVFDATAGDGWEKLATFLGRGIPSLPYPKANVTQIRWLDPIKVVRLTQEAADDAWRVHGLFKGNKSEREQKGNVSRTLGYLIKHAADLAMGKRSVSSVAESVFIRVITKQLAVLSPGIPLIYKSVSDNVSYCERKHWNHLWLIDFPDLTRLSRGTEFVCAVSVALIEDGYPILGVVYAPDINTTYYAMVGKGAFKVRPGHDPEKLISGGAPKQATQQDTRTSTSSKTQIAGSAMSNGFSFCLAAESKEECVLHNSYKWETAAANAVVRLMNKSLVDCSTAAEIHYNNESFKNECIKLG